LTCKNGFVFNEHQHDLKKTKNRSMRYDLFIEDEANNDDKQ